QQRQAQLEFRWKADSDKEAQHAIRPPLPASTSSSKERKHASMPIEAIARDFAIGEKADQWKFAESLANERGFHSGFTEQRGPPGDATDINSRLWRIIEAPGKLAHHADHVATGALRVAAAEQYGITRRDLRPQHQPAPARIDPHQITNEIIPGIRAGHRQPGKDQPSHAP